MKVKEQKVPVQISGLSWISSRTRQGHLTLGVRFLAGKRAEQQHLGTQSCRGTRDVVHAKSTQEGSVKGSPPVPQPPTTGDAI